MTKEEAISAMKAGKKVTHNYFHPDEYIYMKLKIGIDDSYFASSDLELEIIKEDSLKLIEVSSKLQHGISSIFYIYPEDIDSLIDFLQKTKTELI